MKKDRTNITSVEWLLTLSLVISLGLHLAITISMWFSDGITFMHDANFHKPPFRPAGFVTNLIFTFILAFVIFLYNALVYKKQDLKPWLRMTIIIVGCLLITAAMSYIMTLIRPIFLDVPKEHPGDMPMHLHRKVELFRNGFFRDVFTSVIAVFSWQLIVLNQRRKEIAVENEALVAENMRTKYEVLKNQMNPHFMFNSLNTLQGLIATDKDKAQDYLQELSKVLRYTLVNKEVTTLEEELKLTYSYCHLMQIRYGDNLRIRFDIDESLYSYEILPLSLQVLVENAIKHNVISDRQPLTIDVVSDTKDSKIFVNNKLQRKIDAEPGQGIGLANLSERYFLKCGKGLEITKTDTDFKVIIPLNKKED